MAYRRMKKSRKRYYKKGKYGRGSSWASNAPALARTALKTAKWVASLVNTEYKVRDRTIAMSLDNLQYQIVPLTDIAQGDDATQRNGRSVLIKSLYLQLKLKLSTPTIWDAGVARIMLIRDNTCDGALPTMADIVVNSGGDDNVVTSFREILNAPANKYTILYDKRFALDVDFKDEIYFPIYKNFYRNHVKYLGTTANVADLGPGNIFLVATSTRSRSEPNFPFLLSGNARFRYIDN